MIEQSSDTIGNTGSVLHERKTDTLPTGAEGITFIVISELVRAGLTTWFAIGVVTGLTAEEIELAMAGRFIPTNGQREALARLLKNYELAIKLVNAETMKGRV